MHARRIKESLVAPCGMNCGICSNYLAFANGLDRSPCSGCRPQNKSCSYLFGKCTGINGGSGGTAEAKFCFECDQYPCKQIDRMDKRYQTSYDMSVKANLEFIKKSGAEAFLNSQADKYTCPSCEGQVSIHNRKCFKCEKIERLVEKRNTSY